MKDAALREIGPTTITVMTNTTYTKNEPTSVKRGESRSRALAYVKTVYNKFQDLFQNE